MNEWSETTMPFGHVLLFMSYCNGFRENIKLFSSRVMMIMMKHLGYNDGNYY